MILRLILINLVSQKSQKTQIFNQSFFFFISAQFQYECEVCYLTTPLNFLYKFVVKINLPALWLLSRLVWTVSLALPLSLAFF